MPHEPGHMDNTGTQTTQQGGMTKPAWGQYSGKYRSNWESMYRDKPWTEHEHAFRYGWESSFDDKFKGRDFASASMDMERDWPSRYNRFADYAGDKVEGAWNNFKDTVREGWESAKREFDKRF